MKRRWFDNDDIPTNILRRLSVKTLHRLQFVSKQWLNLISDRSFIASHLAQNPHQPLSGFFFQEVFQWADDEATESITYIPLVQENNKAGIFDTVLDFLPENVVILSLNNGLLCCRSCLPAPYPAMYVCNPLKKEWTTLQWPNRLPHKETSVALVFDPFRNPVDGGKTDFELVAVSRIEKEEDVYCFFFDVYSSKTVSWTRSKETCICDHSLVKNKGILVEETVYWLTDGYQILMFDPLNELSWLIETPLPAPQLGRSVPEMCIGEWGGKLCYVIVSEDGLQLWGLENQFSSQWEVRVSIPLDELERENPNVFCNLSEKIGSRFSKDDAAWIDPLAFWDGTLLLRVSACVYLYRFDTRAMRKLCGVSDLGPKAMFSPIVVPYTMSLVPLV